VYEYSHDDPRFSFATSLYFEEEELIVEYMRELRNEDQYRAPPDPDGLKQYSIGFIYLDVYNDLTKFSGDFTQQDLVLLDFQAATTSMSILFQESTSIRRRFKQLLSANGGVGGLFDNEYEGHVFWWHGQEQDLYVRSAYVSPSEIATLLND
jgi:hypothetical protein